MANTNINPFAPTSEVPSGFNLTDSLDENVSNKGASAKAAYQLKRMIGTSANHWNGKKWYGFGTSITDTSGSNPTGKYAPYLAALSGMTFVNKGHGGKAYTSTSGHADVYNDLMSSDLSDADLITIEIGANEGNALLGTVYDGLQNEQVTDNSTICGALNLCIRHLLATTNAQIAVFHTPYQRSWGSTTYQGNEKYANSTRTWLDVENAIEQVCRLNCVYYINAGASLGLARLNGSSGNNYVVDNIHQTNLGGYNFAQAIWSQLKNIPLFYKAIPT